MKNTYGYTIIELFITLSIAGILFGYGAPSLYQFKQKQFMFAERTRLTASLNYARSYAINEQVFVVTCPSLSGTDCDNESNWHQGWIVFADYNRDRSFDADEKLLQFENIKMANLKATSSLYRQKIRFNTMGFSPGTNLSINFCDDRGSEFAISLIVNNVGRVKQSPPISNNACNS